MTSEQKPTNENKIGVYDNPRKVRVAQIVGKTTLGGVCNIVLSYYRGFDRSRYQFDFYTYGESKYDNLVRELGGNVYYISNCIKFPKAMRQLNKAFKERHYDIVHSHLTSLSVFPLLVARHRKIDVRICHAHSTSYWFDPKTIVKNILKHLSRRTATNYLACGKKTGKWMYGHRMGECTIIPNAIDFSSFNRDVNAGLRLRTSFAIKKKEKVICFAGRFVYQKNLFFLLKAFREVNKRDKNFKLMLCGDGKLKQKLIERVEKYGLKDKVFFLETRSIEQMKAVYNASDIFCLTSRFEGLPLSAIEATACGIPGVYSNKITDEILLSDNIQLPVISPKKWAENIIKIAKKDAISDEILEARRTLLKNIGYDIKESAKLLERYYAGCLEGKMSE